MVYSLLLILATVTALSIISEITVRAIKDNSISLQDIWILVVVSMLAGVLLLIELAVWHEYINAIGGE